MPTDKNKRAPAGDRKPASELTRRPHATARVRDEINESPIGLTIVVVPDTYLRLVRDAFEARYVSRDSVAGIPLPKADFLTALHSGGVNAINQLEALAEMEEVPDAEIERAFQVHGSRPNYNFCCDEGLDSLLPIVESSENGFVTFAQSCESLSSEQLMAAIHEISTTARSASAYVVMFLAWTDPAKMPNVGDYCDEYFQVTACEPDPGAHRAFSISSKRLSNMEVFGYGKVICNLFWSKAGYKHVFAPFTACSLLDRFIWRMRASGESLTKIGDFLGMHKSSIKRRLDAMRPVQPETFSKTEFDKYLEALFFDEPSSEGRDGGID